MFTGKTPTGHPNNDLYQFDKQRDTNNPAHPDNCRQQCVKKMKDINMKTIFFGIIGIFVFFGIVWIGAIAYINNSPGLYKYSVDIEGLNNYQPGLITDVIVPLPVRDNQQVFADDDLQYQTFGSWKTVLVMTRFGKMLAFESVGRNLTDIHAVFDQKYPYGTKIENITRESLSPVLPYVASPYSQPDKGDNPSRDYSTIVFIPDTIRPLHPATDALTFNLELYAFEGMQHSMDGASYQVTVSERIPAGVVNMTPVVARVH
jgi:hypothetical protein